jgi:Asp-tRNA(Asn)/Glu-tRNA(Gln) amidotransferase A subunit family amidase
MSWPNAMKQGLLVSRYFYNIEVVLTWTDSAAAVHGAPISIQLVSRNLHDEELLAIGSVVDACLNGA